MYESHWGLSESPFRGSIDPRYFYESPTHSEALARIHFLVENRRKLAVLCGNPGSGKSLLLEVAAEDLRKAGREVAQFSLVGLQSDEFLEQVCTGLKMYVDHRDSTPQMWRMIVDRIRSNHCRQVGLVLLIDDLHYATEEMVHALLRMLAIDPSSQSPLSVVLACDTERLQRVDRAILERTQLKIELEPWDQNDTEGFLKHVFTQAGGDSACFSPVAVDRLQQLAAGSPRALAQLAELSLVAGMGADLTEVDETIVNEVFNELSINVR